MTVPEKRRARRREEDCRRGPSCCWGKSEREREREREREAGHGDKTRALAPAREARVEANVCAGCSGSSLSV